MVAFLVALLVAQNAVALSPVSDVRLLKLSQPKVIAEIDTVKAGGEPVGLALKDDGTVYLRVSKDDKTRHYLIATRPAVSVGQSDGVPVWAGAYWEWKSAIAAPGDPTLKIEARQRRDVAKTQNVSSGAMLAGNMSSLTGDAGEGVAASLVIAAANNTVVNGVVTLRFKDQVIGEWTNEIPVLGVRFGWAPAPMGLLAYVDADGRLSVIDREGRKAVIPGVTQALLPAWSPDGRQILYLQKRSRTLYQLAVTSVE